MTRKVMPANWPTWAKIRKIDKADHLGTSGATWGVFNGKECIVEVYDQGRGWAWRSCIEEDIGGGQGWSWYPNRFEAFYDVVRYLDTVDPGVQ